MGSTLRVRKKLPKGGFFRAPYRGTPRTINKMIDDLVAWLKTNPAATFEAAGVAMPPHVDQVLAGAVSFVTMLGLK